MSKINELYLGYTIKEKPNEKYFYIYKDNNYIARIEYCSHNAGYRETKRYIETLVKKENKL